MIVVMVFLQGIGFRSRFAFGDGIYGEKREAKVEKFPGACRNENTGNKCRESFRPAWICGGKTD